MPTLRLAVHCTAAVGAAADDAKAGALDERKQAVARAMDGVVRAVESLVVKEITNTDDLGDAVEREMMMAAQAIEDAARRLADLMNAPRESATPAELNVNKGAAPGGRA